MNLMRLNSIITEGIESAGVFNYTSAEDLTESYNEFQLNLLAEQQASDNIYEFFNGSLLESSSLCTFEVEILQENFIKNAFNKIIEFFTKIINWIKEMAKKFVDFIKGLFSKKKEQEEKRKKEEIKIIESNKRVEEKSRENNEYIRKVNEANSKTHVIECYDWIFENNDIFIETIDNIDNVISMDAVNSSNLDSIFKKYNKGRYGIESVEGNRLFTSFIDNCWLFQDEPNNITNGLFGDLNESISSSSEKIYLEVSKYLKGIVANNNEELKAQYTHRLKGDKTRYTGNVKFLRTQFNKARKTDSYIYLKKISAEMPNVMNALTDLYIAHKSALEKRKSLINNTDIKQFIEKIISGIGKINALVSKHANICIGLITTTLTLINEHMNEMDRVDNQISKLEKELDDLINNKNDTNPKTGNKYKPYTPDLTKSQEEQHKDFDEFMADPDARLTFK